jgi:hypothetical protein
MPNDLAYIYTSKEAVEQLYGSAGKQAIVQDMSSTNLTEWWVVILSDATDKINQYCLPFYEDSDLYTSRWVHVRATWIAAHFLSQRRGNPGLFSNRYEEIISELEMVLAGIIQIPNLPTRNDFVPGMSNLVVDDHFQISKVRVQPFISVGGTYGNQQIAYRWPFDWLILSYVLLKTCEFGLTLFA